MTLSSLSENAPPRLQKFLAGWGIASRRMIEDWMREGRVILNGRRARPGDVLKDADELLVLDIDGSTLYRASLRGVYDVKAKCWLKHKFEYWALNKPRGVIASVRDPHHKRMVTHLVASSSRLFPVGRLDIDSEGLILLTSDGELCHLLTHPRFGVKKRYEVMVDWPLEKAAIEAIRRGGVILEDGPTMPVGIKALATRRLEIVMREGRKREIRRLMEHFGRRVVKLVRVAFGPIELAGLASGSARMLSETEVSMLREAAGRGKRSPSHHSVEKRDTERDTRRPGPRIPGHRNGLRSSRSSTRSRRRNGSFS